MVVSAFGISLALLAVIAWEDLRLGRDKFVLKA